MGLFAVILCKSNELIKKEIIMKTAFLIDSPTNFAQEYSEREDVFEIVLSAIFPNGETINDTSEPENVERFLELRPQFEEKPKSSQPSLGSINAVFEKIIEQGYDRIIGIVLGENMSGTLQSTRMIAEEFEDKIETHIFDSGALGPANYALLEEAIRLVESGVDIKTIENRMNQLINEMQTFILPEDISGMQSGGRFKATEEAVVALNNTKNILHFTNEGTIELLDKVRTRRIRETRLLDFIKEARQKFDETYVIIMHTNADEEMTKFSDKINEVLSDVRVRLIDMRPALMCHVDEKGYCLSVVPVLP